MRYSTAQIAVQIGLEFCDSWLRRQVKGKKMMGIQPQQRHIPFSDSMLPGGDNIQSENKAKKKPWMDGQPWSSIMLSTGTQLLTPCINRLPFCNVIRIHAPRHPHALQRLTLGGMIDGRAILRFARTDRQLFRAVRRLNEESTRGMHIIPTAAVSERRLSLQ